MIGFSAPVSYFLYHLKFLWVIIDGININTVFSVSLSFILDGKRLMIVFFFSAFIIFLFLMGKRLMG